MNKKKEETDMEDSINESQKQVVIQEEKNLVGPEIYAANVNDGTEEISQEDLNLPLLKIIQSNSQDEIAGKKEGWFYRSDTQEQLETVDVNFVYVTNQEMNNYMGTAKETVKVYYGFYAGTNEPFRLFIRPKSWSGQAHRDFQSYVNMAKVKYRVPMFSLKVRLATEKQSGTLPGTNKPYTTYKLLITPQKDQEGNPIIELDANRIGFLHEAINAFKQVATVTEQTFEEELKSK